MFRRLTDFRRVATRYDRLAVNFLAAVCIAAIVSYWLRVRDLTNPSISTASDYVNSYSNDHSGEHRSKRALM